jgi:hypothetical protein
LDDFTKLIETHERKWGERAYPGRPALSELLVANIVAVWRTPGGIYLSTHSTWPDLDSYTERVIKGEPRTLLKVFEYKQPVEYKLLVRPTTRITPKVAAYVEKQEPPRDRVAEFVEKPRPQPEAEREPGIEWFILIMLAIFLTLFVAMGVYVAMYMR